jgi:thymidylate synthase (FAD)
MEILNNGIIRLVSFMGGDDSVVQAARVSFGKGTTGDERDKKLIHYLMANKHETPFEHSVFKFHVKCPIFIARQWFRHRIASYNEISGRYSEMKEEFFTPENLRTQKASNYKFGEIESELNDFLKEKIEKHWNDCYELYNLLLNKGVAKEHARIVLPLSLYTQFYWTINLRSLMNFLVLRLDSHAQAEIQEYGKKINDIFKEKMPISHEAFEKYIINKEIWED